MMDELEISDLCYFAKLMGENGDKTIIKELEVDKFILDRMDSMTEEDLLNALMGFTHVENLEMIEVFEKTILNVIASLTPKTVAKVLYFYGKQRKGTHTFIDTVSKQLISSNAGDFTDP